MSNEYLPPVQHEYSVGDRVRVNGEHEGLIVSLMPYTFVSPGYDVLIDGKIVAKSERYLEKIASQAGETV